MDIRGNKSCGGRTQEASVGDMGKDLDSCPLDSNNPGGRGGISGVSDNIGIVGGADQAEDEDTDDVEQEDTDPDTADGAWDVFSGVMHFCGGHPENLSSQEGVGSVDQDRPDTSKTAQRARDALVLNERAGVMLRKADWVILLVNIPGPRETYPVTEPETVMGRSTAQVDNETENNETEDCDDLDGGKPELAFTEGAGAQKVDDDNNDTGDGDPYCIVNLVVPVCERS